MPILTAELLTFYRKAVRVLVGLLTGRCRLNKSNLDLEEDTDSARKKRKWPPTCCHCDGLTKVRLLQLGLEKSSANEFMKGNLSGLWSLIKRLKLDKVL